MARKAQGYTVARVKTGCLVSPSKIVGTVEAASRWGVLSSTSLASPTVPFADEIGKQ